MVTGGFHLLVAVAGGWDMWRDIIMDGFAASIGNDAERAYACGRDTAPFGGYIAVLYP